MATKDEKHRQDLMAVARYVYDNNGRLSHKAIAEGTGLTENQVKHALEELKDEDHVVQGFTVDLAFLGFPLRYRVDICVNPGQLREGKGGLPGDSGVDSQKNLARYILKRLPNQKPFAGKILVEDVRILLGHPADLTATVRASSTDAMLEFVTEGLRMCNAVSQTVSCLEAWSCRDGQISTLQNSVA